MGVAAEDSPLRDHQLLSERSSACLRPQVSDYLDNREVYEPRLTKIDAQVTRAERYCSYRRPPKAV